MVDWQELKHEHRWDCFFGANSKQGGTFVCLVLGNLLPARLTGVPFPPTLKNGEMSWPHSS